eukprot:1139417-Pelagomonas_calceolata.AAC.8
MACRLCGGFTLEKADAAITAAEATFGAEARCQGSSVVWQGRRGWVGEAGPGGCPAAAGCEA